MEKDGWEQAKQASGSVWKQIKRGGESAADAAQRAMHIQRLKAQMRKLRSQRRKTIYAIGEQVYALHARGKVRNLDVLDNCQSIDEFMQQVAQLQEQIDSIRAQGRRARADAQELTDDSFLTEEEDVEEEEAAEDEPADTDDADLDEAPDAEVEADEPEGDPSESDDTEDD